MGFVPKFLILTVDEQATKSEKAGFSLIFILFISAFGVLLGQTMGVHVVEYLSMYGHLSDAVSIRMRVLERNRDCDTA